MTSAAAVCDSIGHGGAFSAQLGLDGVMRSECNSPRQPPWDVGQNFQAEQRLCARGSHMAAEAARGFGGRVERCRKKRRIRNAGSEGGVGG